MASTAGSSSSSSGVSSSSSSSSGGSGGSSSSSGGSSGSKSKAKLRSCFGPECDLPGPDGAIACPALHSYEYARSLPASCYPTEGNPLYLQPQTEGGHVSGSSSTKSSKKATKGPLNWSSNWPKPKWALDNNGKDDDFGEGQDVFFPTNKGNNAAASSSSLIGGSLSTTAAAAAGGGNSSSISSSKAPTNTAASSSTTNTGPPPFAFGLPPKGLTTALPGMKFLSIQEGADGKLVAVENTPPVSILSSAEMLAASNKQHLTDAMLMRGKPEWAEQEVELMRKISELPNKPTLEQVKEATLPTLIERGYSYAEASMLFDRFYKTSDESSKKEKASTRTQSENKPVASSQLKSKDGSSSSSSRLREEALAMEQNESKEDVEAANEFIRSHVASLEASKAQLLSEKEALDAEINALRKQKNDLEAVPKPSRSRNRDQELQQTSFGIYIRGGIAEPILEASDDEVVPSMDEVATIVHTEIEEIANIDININPFKRYLFASSNQRK